MPAFIERAIQFHSRKGIRWWCDCSFCTAKKLGTYRIGHYRHIAPGATSYANHYPQLGLEPYPWKRGAAWEIEDFYRRLVETTREGERVKLRAELKDLKQQVI